MQTFEKIIDSISGHPITLLIRMPDQTPKGVVQINTGTCIPQKVYWRFAEFLAQNGYITITYDYSDSQNFSSTVSHTDWVKDLESVFDFVLKEYPNLRKIVVGHSSGGQLIGMMPNASKIDRIYLVASANGYTKLLTWTERCGMWFFWNIIVPLNIRRFGYFNNKVFGASGGFPATIILELRSFCREPDFFIPFFKSKNVPLHYDEVTTKVKAYQLEGDKIANAAACRRMMEMYKNADRTLVVLKARDYGLKKFGHRSFFSNTSQKIWDEFLADLEHP